LDLVAELGWLLLIAIVFSHRFVLAVHLLERIISDHVIENWTGVFVRQRADIGHSIHRYLVVLAAREASA
jgi:hypothetical protein